MNKYCEIKLTKKEHSIEELRKFYKSLEKNAASVGIHREEGTKVINDKGFTQVRNARIQEFGNSQFVSKDIRFKSPITGEWFFIAGGTTLTIPPRPFIRIFHLNTLKNKKLTQRLKNAINERLGKNAKEVYEDVGTYARLIQKERIMDKISPKNTEMTQKYKGFNHPLIMSGNLIDDITNKVI